MARYGRGLICLSMTPERLDELEIPLMVSQNTVALRHRVLRPDRSEGPDDHRHLGRRSRGDGAQAPIDPATRPADLARPGHMFPLRARTGGVMVRAGQTEAAVDLARIAGLYPAGVICEIMNEDGTMARVPQLTKFAQEARPADDHDRGSDQVPHAHRVARQARRRRRSCRREYGDFHDPRVREPARQPGARRAGPRRHRRRQGRARARPLVSA